MNKELPQALLESLKNIPSFNEEAFTTVHEAAEVLTSIRSNPFKNSSKKENHTIVLWNKDGQYLENRPSFTFDPHFHAGTYYVQEASSMFLRQALEHTTEHRDLTILDLCAAPGGKSTLISSFLNNEGLLVANEIIKSRVNILADNLSKWGPANTIVTNNDPKDFSRIPGFFDIVVADAPCSGSGMFRKDPDAINEWSEDNVILCSQRQQRILANIYPAIKETGYLIYSTCSYSEEENEHIVDWLIDTFKMESLQLPLNKEWGIIETQSDKYKGYGYRFYPDKIKGEGFFIACLKKLDPAEPARTKKTDLKNLLLSKNEESIVSHWIKDPKQYTFFKFSGDIYAFPKDEFNSFLTMQQNLHIKKSGIRIGKVAGKDLIPDHELALSLLLSEKIERIELDQKTAIKYLQREDFNVTSHYKGWALMCFEGFALGWTKILPNRVNNYYPKELRILKRS